MIRPRLLDLCCCAGGAGMGYHRAGFEVVGVDINPQPRYPFEFHQADALEFLAAFGRDFDAVHISPPCPAYSPITPTGARDNHPRMIEPARAALIANGRPWVMENVPQAPLDHPILLCGSMFGLPIIRHRSFEMSHWMLTGSDCTYAPTATVTHRGRYFPFGVGNWEPAWRKYVIPEVFPWMLMKEAREAIPPAYTEFIGHHLLSVLAANQQISGPGDVG